MSTRTLHPPRFVLDAVMVDADDWVLVIRCAYCGRIHDTDSNGAGRGYQEDGLDGTDWEVKNL